MTIRCAVLVVATDAEPVSDEMVDGVRSLLGQNVPALFFVEERRVASVGITRERNHAVKIIEFDAHLLQLCEGRAGLAVFGGGINVFIHNIP